jgi:hypothetical protein
MPPQPRIIPQPVRHVSDFERISYEFRWVILFGAVAAGFGAIVWVLKQLFG